MITELFYACPWLQQILIGLIVAAITSFIGWVFIDRKTSKEKIYHIRAANDKVLSTIRQLMPEQLDLIDSDLIRSTIRAEAMTHGVYETELLDIESISNLLIKEVLSSPYLSANDKIKLCNKIQSLQPLPIYPDLEEEIREKLHKQKQRLKLFIAFMAFASVFLITLVWLPSDTFSKISQTIGLGCCFLYATTQYYLLHFNYSYEARTCYVQHGTEYTSDETADSQSNDTSC